MKVFVVETLWRNDTDFGAYVKVFSTKDKAKSYFLKECRQLVEDYSIDTVKDAKHLNVKDNSLEYVSGDYDYFNVDINETEVL